MIGKHLRNASIAAAAVAAGILPLRTAVAFVEPPQSAELEIQMPMPEYTPYEHQSASTSAAARALEAGFSARHGGTWRAYGMSPATGTPSRFIGSGIETHASLTTDDQAFAAALALVRDNPDVFRADVASLVPDAVRRGKGLVGVHFAQTHNGVPVWDARVQLTFTESGRCYSMGSRVYPNITVDTTPHLSQAQAEDIARQAVLFNPNTDRLDGETELMVLPVHVTETAVDHRLVWKVRVRVEDPVAIWVTHVDAHSGEIVWRWNDVHYLVYSGNANSNVSPVSYCNGDELQPSPYLRLTVSGLGTFTTAADGTWNAGEGGTGLRAVTADLFGPYVDINNVGGAEAAFNGSASGGVPFTLTWSDANSHADERDVFDSVNDVHDFFETFDPGYGYTNTQITGNVSRPDVCNAYWDGTINFYPQGGGCANTGEIAGVVHHEFGHGVQDDLIGSQGGQGLGEGNADVLANIMTMESPIGRGFFIGNCTSGIRDSENTLQYPEDVVGQEVHDAGRVIAGFHWDLLQALQASLGAAPGRALAAELWHYARKLEMPSNQPNQVLSVFVTDDSPAFGGDGNLDNGTPHYAEICEAATNHGFECPEILVGVLFTHTPLLTRETPGDDTVVATIISTEAAIDASTARVSYQRNGAGFVDVPMSPTGNPNEYAATLTGLTQPTEVEYYLYAEDVVGNVGTDPRGAPTTVHRFDVATEWEPLEVDNGGWVVNLEGTDNATTGIWVHADPNGTTTGGTPVQPGDDHTEPGTRCWVTGNTGSDAGTDDIDGGSTTLYTAGYNLSGATSAIVKYFRYYSNSLGADPQNDTWVVQIRNNGGAWSDVERNQTNQNQWFQVSFDAHALYGAGIGNVQLKFIGSDLASGSLVEALVDDFEILANLGGGVDVPIEEAPGAIPKSVYLADAKPNPFNPRTTIRYGLSEASAVRVEIYDITGRLVRALVNTTQAAGNYAIVWDGGDDAGRPASSGTYYSRLTTASGTHVKKLTLLK